MGNRRAQGYIPTGPRGVPEAFQMQTSVFIHVAQCGQEILPTPLPLFVPEPHSLLPLSMLVLVLVLSPFWSSGTSDRKITPRVDQLHLRIVPSVRLTSSQVATKALFSTSLGGYAPSKLNWRGCKPQCNLQFNATSIMQTILNLKLAL